MTQEQAVLAALESGLRLTPLNSFHLCGTLALHSLIARLRKKGYDIDCKLIRVDGKTVGEYSLALKVVYG